MHRRPSYIRHEKRARALEAEERTPARIWKEQMHNKEGGKTGSETGMANCKAKRT